jgi:hypothetical protein
MSDPTFEPTIIEEVIEYARVANRHQKMAIVELAFLQDMFGEGFVLSKAVIREHVRFPQRDKNFLRVVQELLHGGHIVRDREERYSIVRTWYLPAAG